MKLRLAPLVLLAAAAAGCGGSSGSSDRAAEDRCAASKVVPAAQDCTLSGRAYTVVRPAGADASYPVVVVLHGVGGPAASRRAVAETSRIHRGGDAVVVYPEARDGAWGEHDVAFVRALLRAEHAERAAVVGWSGSGFLAHRLGCALAGEVDAVAVLHAPLRGDCRPARPVSVLQLAGTADDVIPYRGGPTPEGFDAPPVRTAMAAWRRALRCDPPWRSRDGRVTTERAECPGGTRVELRTIRGGRHVWFGPGEQAPDDAVDATSLVRAFIAAR